MTEPNVSNHWDLLASELGATTPSEESAAPQPSPAPPPSVQKPVHHERKAPPATANWDMLASELGIAPAAPVAPVASVTPAEPAAAAPSPEPVAAEPELKPFLPWTPKPDPLADLFGPLPERERTETPSEAPEESPNYFDERFDFEEPYDLLESSEAEKSTEEAVGEDSESTEEKRPRRRRRRRRRGRGGEQRRPSEPVSDEDSGQVASEEEAVAAGEESLGEEEQPVGEESETGRTSDRRSRRRRPRRGRNRRDTESESPAGAEPVSSVEEEFEHTESFDDAETAEAGAEGDVEGEQPARMGFRGIPTWEDAVGLLIDKNIEARSKRPAGGPHHNGHGNRGQRDNRGGRSGKR